MLDILSANDIEARMDVFIRHLDSMLEDSSDEYDKHPTSKYKDVQTRELITASLLWLHKVGATNLSFSPKGANETSILFSATKKECEETADVYNEDDDWLSKLEGRKISVPNVFGADSIDTSRIWLSFDFPQNSLGEFCKDMMLLLREWCTSDIDVINMAIFMDAYLKSNEDLYKKCIFPCFLGLWEVDHWESLPQIPWEIHTVMSWILNMRGELNKVYDPFMQKGMCSLFYYKEYHAHTTDQRNFYAIRLINAIFNKDWEHIEMGDGLEKWNPGSADTIIAIPDLSRFVQVEGDKSISISEWVLKKVADCMKDTERQVLLVLPSKVLYEDGEYGRLRSELSENNLLDVVVVLPPNVFPNTGTSLAIVLLCSNREANEDIWMIDLKSAPMKHEDEDDEDSRMIIDTDLAAQIFDNHLPKYFKTIKPEDVQKFDYDWYAPSYFKHEQDIPHGYMRVKICDFINEIELTDFHPLVKCAIVREEDLMDDPFVPNLLKSYKSFQDIVESSKKDIEAFSNVVSTLHNGQKTDVDWSDPKYKVDYTYYRKSDVLVCVFDGEKFKTAWYEHEPFSSLRIDGELTYYAVNKDEIDIDFLRLLLFNAANDFFTHLKNGGHYSETDILKTEVVIPMSVDEQKRLYEQAKLNHLVEKARKEGLDEAINRMKDEYISEVRMRKHDMKPYISQLLNLPENVEIYLDMIEGNDKAVSAIREKMNMLSNTVVDLRKHLDRLTEEDIYGTPEVISLLSHLSRSTGSFPNYSVELRVDSLSLSDAKTEDILVYISPVDLSTLTSTIIDNAVKHAFVKEKGPYHILIELGLDKEKDCYVIDFKNDGKPMPMGINKYRYGLRGEKSADSDGSGLGGYRVKSIVHHYGGDYDVFCKRNVEKNKSSITTIRVLLPIFRQK